ncbi:TPA: hypothetical protein VAO37_001703 [Streptococcus agalactiae]|nr:hypothetical protein [Streptococcus agalactiae]HEO2267427.1 hypothetical protein [Streptococcus agalactiae]
MADLFNEDEKQELKTVIVKYLESVIGGEDINVTVDDDGIFAEYIVEVYVDQGSDFSLYRDELIADKILTKEEIADWYYKEEKDFDWRDDYLTFDIGALTDEISDAFPDKEFSEIDKYVLEQVELQGDIDLTEVFDRIYSDCNDSLERDFGEGITFELLSKDIEIYNMIKNYGGDYVWVAEDLVDAEAFSYVPFYDLSRTIVNSPNSVVRRNLLSEFCQDGDIDDYNGNEFFNFVYDKLDGNSRDIFDDLYEDADLVDYIMEGHYTKLPNGKILFCSYF